MRAGAMKYKLELLEPTTTTDRMGAERVEYKATRTVHAERVTTSGGRSEEVGEHFAAYKAVGESVAQPLKYPRRAPYRRELAS